MKALLTVFIVLLSILAFTIYKSHNSEQAQSYVASYKPLSPADSKTIWLDVQEWRKENGYSEYKEDDSLCAFADKRLVAVQDNFSHDGFVEASHKELKNYKRAGENLARVLDGDHNFLKSWLSSESHRAILEDSFTYSCIRCEDFTCVQVFAQ